MSSSDRFVVKFVEDGIQVVMPPITLPPFVLLPPEAFGSFSLLGRWFLLAEFVFVVLELLVATLFCCVLTAVEIVDEMVVAGEALGSFSCKQLYGVDEVK